MSARIKPLVVDQAEGRAQELFQALKAKVGKVPNMMRTMGHAPSLLEGYLNLSQTLAGGVLPVDVRERVNLAVSQANGCEYCVSAHAFLAKRAGLKPDEILAARRGEADDPKAQAVLRLALGIVEHRGSVSDEELAAAREAGVSEAELTELVGHVALITLTNWFNQFTQAQNDYPVVPLELPTERAA